MARPIFFPISTDFRRWLEANHQTAPELLVGFWKKGSGKASIAVSLRRQGPSRA